MTTRRRGRGEGSIVKRADGRWMGRVDVGWSSGKRRSKAIYGRTRREVAVKLREALKKAEEGTLVVDERQTVGEFLARWLQDVVRARVRPRTLDGYEASITHHIAPTLGRIRLSKLTPQHLQPGSPRSKCKECQSAGGDTHGSSSGLHSLRLCGGASSP